jgi:hypothetical protein
MADAPRSSCGALDILDSRAAALIEQPAMKRRRATTDLQQAPPQNDWHRRAAAFVAGATTVAGGHEAGVTVRAVSVAPLAILRHCATQPIEVDQGSGRPVWPGLLVKVPYEAKELMITVDAEHCRQLLHERVVVMRRIARCQQHLCLAETEKRISEFELAMDAFLAHMLDPARPLELTSSFKQMFLTPGRLKKGETLGYVQPLVDFRPLTGSGWRHRAARRRRKARRAYERRLRELVEDLLTGLHAANTKLRAGVDAVMARVEAASRRLLVALAQPTESGYLQGYLQMASCADDFEQLSKLSRMHAYEHQEDDESVLGFADRFLRAFSYMSYSRDSWNLIPVRSNTTPAGGHMTLSFNVLHELSDSFSLRTFISDDKSHSKRKSRFSDATQLADICLSILDAYPDDIVCIEKEEYNTLQIDPKNIKWSAFTVMVCMPTPNSPFLLLSDDLAQTAFVDAVSANVNGFIFTRRVLRLVCRRMRDLCDSSRASVLKIAGCHLEPPEQAEGRYSRIRTPVFFVGPRCLAGCMQAMHTQVQDLEINGNVGSCSLDLRQLGLDTPDWGAVFAHIQQFHGLRHFKLDNSQCYGDMEPAGCIEKVASFRECLQAWPQLLSLSMVHVALSAPLARALARPGSVLRELRVNGGQPRHREGDNTMQCFCNESLVALGACTSLEVLSIADPDEQWNAGIERMLDRIDVGDGRGEVCLTITDEGLEQFATAISTAEGGCVLKSLTLKNCTYVTGRCLSVIARECTSLRCLEFVQHKRVGPRRLEAVEWRPEPIPAQAIADLALLPSVERLVVLPFTVENGDGDVGGTTDYQFGTDVNTRPGYSQATLELFTKSDAVVGRVHDTLRKCLAGICHHDDRTTAITKAAARAWCAACVMGGDRTFEKWGLNLTTDATTWEEKYNSNYLAQGECHIVTRLFHNHYGSYDGPTPANRIDVVDIWCVLQAMVECEDTVQRENLCSILLYFHVAYPWRTYRDTSRHQHLQTLFGTTSDDDNFSVKRSLFQCACRIQNIETVSNTDSPRSIIAVLIEMATSKPGALHMLVALRVAKNLLDAVWWAARYLKASQHPSKSYESMQIEDDSEDDEFVAELEALEPNFRCTLSGFESPEGLLCLATTMNGLEPWATERRRTLCEIFGIAVRVLKQSPPTSLGLHFFRSLADTPNVWTFSMFQDVFYASEFAERESVASQHNFVSVLLGVANEFKEAGLDDSVVRVRIAHTRSITQVI